MLVCIKLENFECSVDAIISFLSVVCVIFDMTNKGFTCGGGSIIDLLETNDDIGISRVCIGFHAVLYLDLAPTKRFKQFCVSCVQLVVLV